jgi:hypothetical protein
MLEMVHSSHNTPLGVFGGHQDSNQNHGLLVESIGSWLPLELLSGLDSMIILMIVELRLSQTFQIPQIPTQLRDSRMAHGRSMVSIELPSTLLSHMLILAGGEDSM